MALRPYTQPTVTIASAGTAYQLSNTPNTFANTVTMMADPANTGIVYFGDSNVTAANGMGALGPKDIVTITQPVTSGYHDVWDLSTIYVTSTANGDKVRVMTSDKGL